MNVETSTGITRTHAFRLHPGQDLKKEIQSFVNEKKIMAGWVTCCVGSLTRYDIRFANQLSANTGSGFFEIVSFCGTVSMNGCHLHMSISDSKGQTIGGHLLESNIIYTTAEIVIQEATDLIFHREKDGATSWKELQVSHKK